MHEYMQNRLFNPIGFAQASWDVIGGTGSIGPHTSAHVGMHISARELARIGYLAIRQGCWDSKLLIPRAWLKLATQSSQELNPNYGYAFWVNSQGTRWPGLPNDMFAMEGHNSNRCYIISSLDLVVARVGSGPRTRNETDFITQVVEAIN